MLRSSAAFLLGVACTLTVGWIWIYPSVARGNFEFGMAQGKMSAQAEIARMVRVSLGEDFDRTESTQPFYGVKGAAVFVVVRNGTKTLRVYPDGNPEAAR